MIAPHATPAAAHAALAEFVSDDAPPLIAVDINKCYGPGPLGQVTYSAEIHVHGPQFGKWLVRHGFTEAEVERIGRSDGKDNLQVVSQTGVSIFCIADKLADGGESA